MTESLTQNNPRRFIGQITFLIQGDKIFGVEPTGNRCYDRQGRIVSIRLLGQPPTKPKFIPASGENPQIYNIADYAPEKRPA